MKRFQLVKIKSDGFLPYGVIDTYNQDEMVVTADDVRSAKEAADDLNRMVMEDEAVTEAMKKLGL